MFSIYIFCFFNVEAQCPTSQQFYQQIINIETTNAENNISLQQTLALKKKFEDCRLEKDSVYARILNKTGTYQYKAGFFNDAVKNTITAAAINTSGRKNVQRSFSTKSYFNLGYYYNKIGLYSKSIKYFDSCITIGTNYSEYKSLVLYAWQLKCNAYFKVGDYEKDIQTATLAIRSVVAFNDTANLVSFLLERAQAYERVLKIEQATADINQALLFCDSKNYPLLANANHIKGDILFDKGLFKEAVSVYKKTIDFRTKAENFSQVAVDYNDLGYLIMQKIGDAQEGKKYFSLSYNTAFVNKDFATCALASDNMAQVSLLNKNYAEALKQSHQALKILAPKFNNEDVISNPNFIDLATADKKNLLDLLINKVTCLIYYYKKTNKIFFLDAVVSTSMLADSVITNLRNEQLEERSKLFWRTETKDFYANAIEACYIGKKPDVALYFMEKSRAVLLNDNLNELGAAAKLPAAEAAKQESYQVEIIEQLQKLSALDATSIEYANQQTKFLQAKENFNQFIQSLEQKYPAYYHYKYDDKVPSLKDLQQYLAKNNQSFVHYFFGDTATYILAITAGKTNFIKLSQKDFNKEQLSDFIKLCADKQALNNNYTAFTQLSNSIYKKIFQPLQLPKGRIIICTDNAVIPFDALCSNDDVKDFLLNDYSFSYVYSARSLMRQFEFSNPQGNFVGFAPVSFEKYLHVQDLKNAANALDKSAAYYTTDKLFTHQTATRNNFFNYASSYSVVNIFSHARADTSDNEPVLFMQDSLIHLSELQLLNNPATQLVLLSACQTNVGKAATGEGIYSLARGFATAGIPSVSATLWKADEQAIYAISQKFNEYLSEGMNKDEALQKAKLYFVQNNSAEKLLPYFWANMILIGNADALKLSSSSSNNYLWIIIAAAIVLLIAIIFILRKKHLNNSVKAH